MKKLLSVYLCINFLLLTGCQNAVEVRERAFVQSASFSGNNNISLTLYPFEEEKDKSYGNGLTIAEAIENTAVFSGKDVFMGHLELLCFDEPDFTEKLESCLIDYRISPSCKLLYLSEISILENCDTTLLTDRLTMEEEKGHIPKTDLFHILSERKRKDSAALVPAVTKNSLSMCILKDGSKPYVVSAKAAEGLCWLRGENYPERISVSEENNAVDFEIYSAKTKLSSEIKNNIPYITACIKVKGTGNEQAARNIIESQCKAAIEETLERAKSDVIGIDECLAKDCPEYYAEQDFETVKWALNFQCTVEFE